MKKNTVKLSSIVHFAEQQLKNSQIQDYPQAYNGLQVENNGKISRIVCAVDAHEQTLRRAIGLKADLLIVHHGLFWGQPLPLTGVAFRRIKLCLENNLAVYSSHLPLDLHPVIGNNICLARSLGFRSSKPFFEMNGNLIGRYVQTNTTRKQLVSKLRKLTGFAPHLISGGSEQIKKIGIVSGGGSDCIFQAIDAGMDTFITGEGPHHTFGIALENGINLIYAGHYATETFGVKALADLISKKFGISSEFIDIPSGL